MYLICRRQGNASDVLRLECQGNCPEFVAHYLKYNITDSDLTRTVVVKGEIVPMNEFVVVEKEGEGEVTTSPSLKVEKRVVKAKGDCGCKGSTPK